MVSFQSKRHLPSNKTKQHKTKIDYALSGQIPDIPFWTRSPFGLSQLSGNYFSCSSQDLWCPLWLIFYFHSHILSIRKAWFALSTKCIHNPATFDHLCYYASLSLSPWFHPHLLWASSTEQPKRSCFVVSQIVCYLIPWTHILSPLDHSNWASFLLEQARCVSTLGLSHLLLSLQGMLPPHPSDILMTHYLASFRCSNITFSMKIFLRTLY